MQTNMKIWIRKKNLNLQKTKELLLNCKVMLTTVAHKLFEIDRFCKNYNVFCLSFLTYV